MSGSFDPFEEWRRIVDELPDAKLDRIARADLVVQSVLALEPQFWCGLDGEAFMTVAFARGEDDAPEQRFRIGSVEAQHLIRCAYSAAHPVSIITPGSRPRLQPAMISDGVMRTVQAGLAAIAWERKVLLAPAVRIAETRHGIWLDLGDATGRVVRIMSSGWSVVGRTVAPLVRNPGMQALPRPSHNHGGVARELADLFGLDGDQFMLLTCWMLDALRPGADHPILLVFGPAGAGKTALCRFLRDTIDPHRAGLESLPLTEQNLAVLADSCWLLAFDNVSNITDRQSDWLCRLVTGYAFRSRKLYADRDAALFTWQGPVAVNGVPSLITKADLASRTLLLHLGEREGLALGRRDLQNRLRLLAPRWLGYLLDGVVLALKGRDAAGKTRLSDAEAWCCAAAPAYGWNPDDIAELFQSQRALAFRELAYNDPVAARIMGWIAAEPGRRWPPPDIVGNPKPFGALDALHERLTQKLDHHANDWPKTLPKFRSAVLDMELALRAVGIAVAWSDDKLGVRFDRG
jgi:hypothetical protein